MRLPPLIEKELRESGLPFRVEPGKGHAKLFLCNRLAGVMPFKPTEADRRSVLNIRAQIRRIIAAEKGDT